MIMFKLRRLHKEQQPEIVKCAQTWENTRKSGSQINHKCRSIQKAQLSEYVDHVCEPHSGWFTNVGYKSPERDIPNFLGSDNTAAMPSSRVSVSQLMCSRMLLFSNQNDTKLMHFCKYFNILLKQMLFIRNTMHLLLRSNCWKGKCRELFVLLLIK